MGRAKTRADSLTSRFRVVPISSLVRADWNYKTEDPEMAAKLRENMKRNGQVENLIVRHLATGFLEIVNGNHRLDAMLDLGYEEVMVCDLGEISDAAARRIAIETNETRFQSDPLRLSALIREIVQEFPLDDALSTLPFSQKDLDNMAALQDFDWGTFDKDGKAELEEPEPDPEDGFIRFEIVIPEEVYRGVLEEAKEKIREVLRRDGKDLHKDEPVLWGQVLEALAAEYLGG